MIIRRRRKLMEVAAVGPATVDAETSTQDVDSENEENSDLEGGEMSEEEKKKKALEEIDTKDDAEIMHYILSGEMPEDMEIRNKIFKRGNDYIQKQMTGTITPDKQKEMYKKILANAGIK